MFIYEWARLRDLDMAKLTAFQTANMSLTHLLQTWMAFSVANQTRRMNGKRVVELDVPMIEGLKKYNDDLRKMGWKLTLTDNPDILIYPDSAHKEVVLATGWLAKVRGEFKRKQIINRLKAL